MGKGAGWMKWHNRGRCGPVPDMRSCLSSGAMEQEFIMGHQLTFADSVNSAVSAVRPERDCYLSRWNAYPAMAGYDAIIEPFIPKPCGRRRPYPLETMLRIHHAALVQPERWRDGEGLCTKSPPCGCLPVIPG